MVRSISGPFFCFYGGKYRAAPHYPKPKHPTIIEPFAGSAGYSLRHPDKEVILYDLDPVIVKLWAYLITVSEEDLCSLPDLGDGQAPADLDVPEGARSLIGFWLNKGVARPRRSPSAWMRSGMRPGSFWGPQVRDRIAGNLHMIRHWQIQHGSYESAPDIDATWFVDAPYQHQGRHYRYSEIDYRSLARWVRSRTGQTIVCEQFPADWLPFKPFRQTKRTLSGPSAEMVYLRDC